MVLEQYAPSVSMINGGFEKSNGGVSSFEVGENSYGRSSVVGNDGGFKRPVSFANS